MAITDYISDLVMMVLAGFLVVFFWLASEFLGPSRKAASPSRCLLNAATLRKASDPSASPSSFTVSPFFSSSSTLSGLSLSLGGRAQRAQALCLIEMIIFIVILFVALGYVWAKGGLEWD